MADLPFLDRPPTASEVIWLQCAFSTFADGSGDPRKAGDTIANWRDYERVFRQFYGGVAPEGKQVYDVFIELDTPGHWAGLSIKSKCLGQYSKFPFAEQAYLELTNSPRKMWGGLSVYGLHESDWGNPDKAQEIGSHLLDVVTSWHDDAKDFFRPPDGKTCSSIEPTDSIYLNVSYSEPNKQMRRSYRIDAFDMRLMRPDTWVYRPGKNGQIRSIMGMLNGNTIWDWYANSGGQLKYYPPFSAAHFSTPIFDTLNPGQAENLEDKMTKYWPEMSGRWSTPT
ncbi:MAG: hypothetical protein AAGI68_12970 [Planctomycetota bacterium]